MSDTSWDTLSANGGSPVVTSKVRVTVCFENGGSIVVPVLPTALVSELMSQALLRAQGLGIECPNGKWILSSLVGKDDWLIHISRHYGSCRCPKWPCAIRRRRN